MMSWRENSAVERTSDSPSRGTSRRPASERRVRSRSRSSKWILMIPPTAVTVSIEAALLFRLRSVLDQLINELFRMADSVFTAKGSSYLFLVITFHGPSPDRWEKCLNNRIFHATMFHRNLRCGLQRGLGPGVRSRIEAAASACSGGRISLVEPRECPLVGDLQPYRRIST